MDLMGHDETKATKGQITNETKHMNEVIRVVTQRYPMDARSSQQI